ncbi:MAG: helix-turn-helix domain-containing protein [Pseudomonadota bacterium]
MIALSTLELILIGFSLAQASLALALLAGNLPLSTQQWFYGGLQFCVGAFLAVPLLQGTPFQQPLPFFVGLIPGMFFLFSVSLFDDQFRLRSWHYLAVLCTAGLPQVARFLSLEGSSLSWWMLVTLPQLMEFFLLAFGLFVAIRYWNVDLVPARRRLRVWFSFFVGTYLVLLIFLREVLLPDAGQLALFQYASIALTLFVSNLVLFTYRSELWASAKTSSKTALAMDGAPSRSSARPLVSSDADADALSSLRRLMEDENVYREMGLTLPQLAERAEVPSYRLRATINGALGYRNFNDYLNSFRISEAAKRLSDPEQADTQVLVIALEAGFRSLSSFNKAFRSAQGMTPTEFRRTHLD